MRYVEKYCGSGHPHPTNRPEYPPRKVHDTESYSCLDSIIPMILDEISKSDYEIGTESEYEYNFFCFNHDGWYAEITYMLSGKWSIDRGDYFTQPSIEPIKIWDSVVEMTVTHHDCKTNDDRELSEMEMNKLRYEIDNLLKHIA